MSGTYPNGAGCVPWVGSVSRPSAPAGGGADVVDVARRAPGPGAVREEVPEGVAPDVRAAGLAEDRDALAAVGVPDDPAAAVRAGTQGELTGRDDASVQARVVVIAVVALVVVVTAAAEFVVTLLVPPAVVLTADARVFVAPFVVAVLSMAGHLLAAPFTQELFSVSSPSSVTLTSTSQTSSSSQQDPLSLALEEAKENGALTQQVEDLQRQIEELEFKDLLLEVELDLQSSSAQAAPFDEDFSTPCPEEQVTGPVTFDEDEPGAIDFSYDNTSGQVQFAEIGLFVKGEMVESYAVSLHHFTDHRVYLTGSMIDKWNEVGVLYATDILIDEARVREIAVNVVSPKNCILGVFGTSVVKA